MHVVSASALGIHGAYYECKCKWKSPVELGDSEGEAIERAYAAAMRRPLQKPLTIEEIRSLPCPFDLNVPPFFWIETRDYIHFCVSQWFSFSSLIEICKLEKPGEIYAYPHPLRQYKYGVDFRAWWKRPTDEECAAAEWDEVKG